MKLTLKRFSFLETCTIGRLSLDYQDLGIFTLEDRCREQVGIGVTEWKIPGETAIPKGTYKVIIDFSEHFQKELPHLLDVPGFEGVRIHSGNNDKDTEGCLLVGLDWNGGDFIGRSRDAFNFLFEKIKLAQEISIEIS